MHLSVLGFRFVTADFENAVQLAVFVFGKKDATMQDSVRNPTYSLVAGMRSSSN